MLATLAFYANEYAKEEKEEKNMIFSAKCIGTLLKYKRDYLYNNMLVRITIYLRLFYIVKLSFQKLILKVGFR